MLDVLAHWLVGQPLHVLAVALVHFGLWAAMGYTRRGNVLWVPALLWLMYAPWEGLVEAVTPEANIRVDLLLIWPLLAIATLWAVVRLAVAWRAGRRNIVR
jgi:hypothetical protein